MITAKGLTKLYDGKHGIRNIDLYVRKGSTFGFLGKNGSGKTTTIKILIGLLKPDSGIASVGGYDVSSDPMPVRRMIGYLPETVGLYEYLTAFDTLDYTARLHRIKAGDRKERIEHILKDLDLYDSRNIKIGNFSKGMRQKLALGRALINDPDVLFLDEPTSGLDPQASRNIEALIKDLKKEGKTVFITSHILSEVEKMCDSVSILKEGTIRASGSMADIKAKYSSPSILVRVSGAPLNAEKAAGILVSIGAEQVEVLDDCVSLKTGRPEELMPAVNRALLEANIPVVELKRMEPALEDVYFKVMEE
ncbi:ABC transporter ATP-binding protein [Methanocella sp. CWC-04]|uniref:ABC transporter ATP-binding protein n=1 Tax=Methanooceanicella nereidis TaxID=2052831 RepID=A0AAP2RFN1_9EURY|nr:ABC transporter ATP-binding protein [Methanocella sp. CWC-04]MCD1295240.1 ABC transporter ATP-binding protein [Methanocella sp. CWC-04]